MLFLLHKPMIQMLDRDEKEILVAEFISITGGLLTGAMLAFALNKIYLIPGLFILLPGFLEMRGALGGALASRISSGLFLGVIKPSFGERIIKSNMLATAALIIVSSFILGTIAYMANSYFSGITSVKIILVSLAAGIISILMTPITVFTTLWLYRRGHDPNNIMGPYITTLGDIMSVIAFMVAIAVI